MYFIVNANLQLNKEGNSSTSHTVNQVFHILGAEGSLLAYRHHKIKVRVDTFGKEKNRPNRRV